ncbi:MAG: hypothetical protein KGJ07_05520 [Patescibacteria group bacterium]|nr:hypothetical protein [Patescibacteria group bacterium]
MKKIVIKIGRSIATSKRNKIDRYRFEQIAKQIKLLQERDVVVVLVVSAAVCCGEYELGLKGEYDFSKSLVAGVGQTVVMADLYTIFVKHNLKVGQLLVTKSDLKDEKKRANIKGVLTQAFEHHITLVVNENDIIELHSFDGNDFLATEIAKLAEVDSLLLLTDVEGVLDKNMQIIKEYSNSQTLAQISKLNHKGEVGGMTGKIEAAMKAAINGIATTIASGKTQNLLTRMFLQNEHIGTRVLGGAI